jgi:hypothetical protein
MLGQKVEVLLNTIKHRGVYQIEWDGSQSASGIYILRLFADPVENSTDHFRAAKKMILLK